MIIAGNGMGQPPSPPPATPPQPPIPWRRILGETLESVGKALQPKVTIPLEWVLIGGIGLILLLKN